MHIRVPHPWVLGRQQPDLLLVLGERWELGLGAGRSSIPTSSVLCRWML